MDNDYMKLFERYGSTQEDAEIRVQFYLTRPDKINTAENVAYYDKEAFRRIESLQTLIDRLTGYRAALCQRYNEIATAPTIPVVKLSREYRYYQKKVFYSLTIASRNINTGDEIITETRKYPGTKRHQAIADYRQYIKDHPGITAEMDIERGEWEKSAQ